MYGASTWRRGCKTQWYPDSITTAETVGHDPLVGGFALTVVRALIGRMLFKQQPNWRAVARVTFLAILTLLKRQMRPQASRATATDGPFVILLIAPGGRSRHAGCGNNENSRIGSPSSLQTDRRSGGRLR